MTTDFISAVNTDLDGSGEAVRDTGPDEGSSMGISGAGTGVRSTRQRSAIQALLGDIDDFRSAQQVHALLRERGDRVGLTTVYRALQLMADAGEVDVLRTAEGEATFRQCSARHHHHLVCRHCGKAVEVEGPGVERWTQRLAADNGFVDVTHTVEIVGTCADCAS
jgi:Fur family ferric uptake transcriptional regulator